MKAQLMLTREKVQKIECVFTKIAPYLKLFSIISFLTLYFLLSRGQVADKLTELTMGLEASEFERVAPAVIASVAIFIGLALIPTMFFVSFVFDVMCKKFADKSLSDFSFVLGFIVVPLVFVSSLGFVIWFYLG